MNKKVKILVTFNCISYMLMLVISYVIITGIINNTNNIIKLILGTLPMILIICTSFICAFDRHKEFKPVKVQAILDLVIRTISFGLVIGEVYYYKNINSYITFIFICCMFAINTILEYIMNKKIINKHEEIEIKKKLNITYEEKQNLRSMVKALNLEMFSILLFCGISLSVTMNKNMEGTTERWYIPVIFSIVVCIWFVKTSYKNYIGFYLDKKYANHIFKRNIIFSLIGFSICLVLSFLKFSNEVYGAITCIGILFLLPTISTARKMSLRLKEIKKSLGKDTYNYFIMKKMD